MFCPQCKTQDTKVIDSRETENWTVIRRRRKCEKCEFRFTTFEKSVLNDIIVIKKDETREEYNREKLKKAILLAFAKRKVSNEEIEDIISKLEQKRIQWKGEVSSEQIWLDVLIFLKEKDPVAYVRFASVYMDFDNLEDFKQLLI